MIGTCCMAVPRCMFFSVVTQVLLRRSPGCWKWMTACSRRRRSRHLLQSRIRCVSVSVGTDLPLSPEHLSTRAYSWQSTGDPTE
jgi:hypothetical protein